MFANGSVRSVNSYGYSGLAYMFGPKFNTVTGNVLADLIDNTPGANTVLHTPSS